MSNTGAQEVEMHDTGVNFSRENYEKSDVQVVNFQFYYHASNK